MRPNDVILLLEKWTRRAFIVDIRETDMVAEFLTQHTTTDKVHHVSEIRCTTDACLDSMTVKARDPADDKVTVLEGKVQWFGTIIQFDTPVESPVLPAYSTADCDPSIVEPIRWSLLCVKKNILGNHELFWAHAHPSAGYPEIPHDGVPLALVKMGPGVVRIEQENIVNWRSIRPGYAPGAKWQYPPVYSADELDKYEDVPEGAQCFVISTGTYYYYHNGAWRAVGTPTFDNTAYYTDIEAWTPRVDLPWPVKTPVELVVFRDGQLMLLNKDYRVMVGQAAYLMFTYNLAPGQRIVVMRNPFLAQAYSPETSLNAVQVHEIWVDGELGSDAFEGSEINPFKTLQRAFDSIPVFSNHIYRVYAKNLKLDDRVTSNWGDTCFGWMNGKQMVALEILVENNFEWDNSIMNAVYSLRRVSTVVYSGRDLRHQIILIDCVSEFTDCDLADQVELIGGTSTLDHIRYTNESVGAPFTIINGAIVRGNRCSFSLLEVNSGSYLFLERSDIATVYSSYGGILIMHMGSITETARFSGSYLDLDNVSLTGTGYFMNSYVSVANITQARGSNHVPFFNCHGENILIITKVNLDSVQGSAITLHQGSMLWMTDSSIYRSQRHGIEMSFNCTAYLYNVDLSGNTLSGIYADQACSIEMIKCKGSLNYRYGVECYNLSRAFRSSDTVTTGLFGPYYELIPGADTVLTERGTDTMPGTLEEKLVMGNGLKRAIVQSGTTGSYRYHIEVDANTLLSSSLINLDDKMQVYQRNTAVPEPPDPQSMTDMPITWTGQGYMSSVIRRIFDPTVRTKIMLSNEDYFDEYHQEYDSKQVAGLGTLFTLTGVTLGLNIYNEYPTNRAYFFHSKVQYPSALQVFGISNISSFELDADVPTGTNLQVAFSVNGSSAWRKWNDTTLMWELLPGESTMLQMSNAPQHTELSTWSNACWDELRILAQTNSSYITVCFNLKTSSTILSPEVHGYTWTFTEDGFWEDVSEYFSKRYYNSRAIFTYKGGLGEISPPVVFSVVPTNHRIS